VTASLSLTAGEIAVRDAQKPLTNGKKIFVVQQHEHDLPAGKAAAAEGRKQHPAADWQRNLAAMRGCPVSGFININRSYSN
jgi:hypothetical protein